MKIYHFTSEQNWNQIQEEWALFPSSTYRNISNHLAPHPSIGISRIYGSGMKQFNVALQNESAWEEYGLLKTLLNHTTGKIKLEDYSGNYNVPEIWIPNRIPLSEIIER